MVNLPIGIFCGRLAVVIEKIYQTGIIVRRFCLATSAWLAMNARAGESCNRARGTGCDPPSPAPRNPRATFCASCVCAARGGRRVRGRAERTIVFTASSASAEAAVEVLCVSLDGSAEQPADEPAEERGSDLAPVLRVKRGAVMAVVVTVIVVMLRLMVPCMGRRRWRVMRDLVPGCRTHWRGMGHRVCPSWCFRRLRRMLGRSRCLCRVRDRRVALCRWRLLRRCLHRRRGLALRRRVPLRSGHRRAAKSAAHRERHNNLLYCLVHCRVPFVVRASPFSRLHKDRTIRRNFLTNDFEADNRSDKSATRDHEIRLTKAITDTLRVLQRGSVAPRRTM